LILILFNKKNLKIFNEKVEFDAAPKVDDFNHDYKKQGGNVKVKKYYTNKY